MYDKLLIKRLVYKRSFYDTRIFKEFLASCNACILSCEDCIDSANACSKNAVQDASCVEFIKRAKICASVSEVCIKACEAMLAELKNKSDNSHTEALNKAVKALGENIRVLTDVVPVKCILDTTTCKIGCQAAKDACNDAIQAVDECIESCEKHEVHYLNIKK